MKGQVGAGPNGGQDKGAGAGSAAAQHPPSRAVRTGAREASWLRVTRSVVTLRRLILASGSASSSGSCIPLWRAWRWQQEGRGRVVAEASSGQRSGSRTPAAAAGGGRWGGSQMLNGPGQRGSGHARGGAPATSRDAGTLTGPCEGLGAWRCFWACADRKRTRLGITRRISSEALRTQCGRPSQISALTGIKRRHLRLAAGAMHSISIRPPPIPCPSCYEISSHLPQTHR